MGETRRDPGYILSASTCISEGFMAGEYSTSHVCRYAEKLKSFANGDNILRGVM